METSKKETAKTVKQAWRKKPRKFAPKSRSGCKTCKIRRIKCDLTRPSCLKCQSTGRICDGYSDIPSASKADDELRHHHNYETSKDNESCDIHQHMVTLSASWPHQWYAMYHDSMPQSPRPFLVLPVTEPDQTEAMSFFEYISVKNLNEYHFNDSWRHTLMFFSQTVPSVRHAAMALALIHRTHLSSKSGGRVDQLQPSKDELLDQTALMHYNRAIRLLLNQETGGSTKSTAITLLVCYLFTCFDHLAGNYVQAVKHLRGGIDLVHNLDKVMLRNCDEYGGAQPSELYTLLGQVTRQIRRLDLQAATFLIDWTPAGVDEKPNTSWLPCSDSVFLSFDQAIDQLHVLVARVMGLRYKEQEMYSRGETPLPSSAAIRQSLLEQLETWSSLFERTLLLQQGSDFREAGLPNRSPLVSLLRLQYSIAWILISSVGPGREMEFDNYLPQFRQCVALADEVAAAHERYSGLLGPTFTPEIGIVPVLYIVGVKCRDPVVRRKVLNILRRQPIREAVWDSLSAARVVEWAIEIEEDGTSGMGATAGSVEHLTMGQRIEALSWVQTSATRMDLTYTFCGREGINCETLVVRW